MKKALFVLAAMAVFAVKADYLYWMVTDNPGTHENYVGTPIDFSGWTDAKLFVDGSSFDNPSSTLVATMTSDDAARLRDNDLYAYANLGSGTYNPNSTFMIELWQGGSYLGYASASADSLAQYIVTPETMAPVVSGWMPGASAYAVPEPTSGLLFLIGGMLLGLKRRRQQV